jgi:hypothetical protein
MMNKDRLIIRVARSKQVRALEKPFKPRVSSAQLKREIEEFLSSGGSITPLEPGQTGHAETERARQKHRARGTKAGGRPPKAQL